jgi:ComF family protein
MTSVRQVTDAILAALLAPPCVSCGRVLEHPLTGAVCAGCWASLPRTSQPASSPSPLIAAVTAIGEYEGTLRSIIHALKYDGRRSASPGLSAALASCGADLLAGADAVVPVPLHRKRERERGFNQAHDLAIGLGPPVWAALRRLRHTASQVDLPADKRHQNVSNAFAVAAPKRSLPWPPGRRQSSRVPRLEGAVLVLVDDVMTTGATLEACARALRAAGVREVRALTAARVGSARH